MSCPVNDIVKEQIMEEVVSMTVEEFQNQVDKYGISGRTVIDEMVDNLIQSKFEERSI